MRRRELVVLGALAVLVGGCVATAPPPHDVSGTAGAVAALPGGGGGGPGLAAQGDYSFEATLAFSDASSEDSGGDDAIPSDHWTLGFTWYPAGVADDESPYALQPYMQRAAYVRAGLGTGSREFGPGNWDWDANSVEFGVALFDDETGLGLRVDSRHESVNSTDDTNWPVSFDHLEAALVWQDEHGFAAELTLVRESKDDIVDQTTGLTLPMFIEFGYRGVRLGARKVFALGGPGGVLDVSGSAEFGKYEWFQWSFTGDNMSTYRLGATWYPVKFLGVGLRYEMIRLETSVPLYRDAENEAFGVSATFTLAERFDIGVDYLSRESDLQAAGMQKELSEVRVTLGYRF